jgi:hypothetical protein
MFFLMFATTATMSLIALVVLVNALADSYTAVSLTGGAWGLVSALAWHYGVAPFYSYLPVWLQ